MWFTEPFGGKIGRISTTGRITEYPLGGSSTFPTGIAAGPGGMWFTASGLNAVGRITPRGDIKLFPVPVADYQVYDITRGPDGHMWYAVQSGRIGRISGSGAITEYEVPGGADKVPFNITTGPDRNIWFTELLASAVGRVQALPGRGTPAAHPAPTGHPQRPLQVPAGHRPLHYVPGRGWFQR